MSVISLLESPATEDWEPNDPEPHFIRIPHSVAQPEGFARWQRGLSYHRLCVSHRGSALWLYPPIDKKPIRIPFGAFTPEGFCQWAASRWFPLTGRVSHFPTELVLDMSPEELTTHNLVKTEVLRVLGNLNHDLHLGKVFSDRALFSNDSAGLRTEPDGVFVSFDGIESGRVQFRRRRRKQEEFTELRGSPDWVLEVVSQTSSHDDYEVLPGLYHAAGVREYWLIDARGPAILFRISKWRKSGYVNSRPRDGWVQSEVFGQAFRLVRELDRVNMWEYRLETRSH